MKKKLLLFPLLALAAASARAEDYSYVAIVMADGSTTTLTAEGLEIVNNSGTLAVSSNEGTLSIPLSNVSFLSFTNTTTAIEGVESSAESAETTIYTLGGIRVGNSLDSLRPGIYIVRQGNTTRKITKQ